MSLSTHLSTLARYHVWATARLLQAVHGVPEEPYRQDVGLYFRSIHGTLNHLLVGERHLWWRRFAEGVSPFVALDAEVESDRALLRAALERAAGDWEPFIAGCEPDRLRGVLSYVTTRGVPASLPFGLTLAHVFNHATHHRGQISAALTRLGEPAPELDLVYFLQAEAQARAAAGGPPTLA